MDNATLNKTLAEYKKATDAKAKAETKAKALKNAIVAALELRGVKVAETEEYTAVFSTYSRESVMLKEALAEFGREVLEAKKLLNTYPVEKLTVTKK
jgi:hypothetical protein